MDEGIDGQYSVAGDTSFLLRLRLKIGVESYRMKRNLVNTYCSCKAQRRDTKKTDGDVTGDTCRM